ncbi:hypothetical protein, conserved [Trypanosoma brucei brucei TREU927]|uniref:Uncharacterized protein n=1 Tax=Trypanosoma brucei brucei (strain 927/4 GUTat10.1) TaxID=185431 RepID=Q385H8_TRYB2|nr:hypothetical protein, conserved [Trypanosoma brucei brucei TREU927]EAN79553.1 hypothetical protein, conserved [Trypanosoma brucei brucei TREU927]
METSGPKTVPGTDLCHRVLYAAVVGDNAKGCLPGSVKKMTPDGVVIVDHVMRCARYYVPGLCLSGSLPTSKCESLLDFSDQVPPLSAEPQKQELIDRILYYSSELESRTQQLELRKQEVQSLQNKLRIVNKELKRRGIVIADTPERGYTKGSDFKKVYSPDDSYIGNNFPAPPNSRDIGSDDPTRPPLPPLRIDGDLRSYTSRPPPPYSAEPLVPPFISCALPPKSLIADQPGVTALPSGRRVQQAFAKMVQNSRRHDNPAAAGCQPVSNRDGLVGTIPQAEGVESINGVERFGNDGADNNSRREEEGNSDVAAKKSHSYK